MGIRKQNVNVIYVGAEGAPTKSTCNASQTQGDWDLNPQQDRDLELRPLNESRTFKWLHSQWKDELGEGVIHPLAQRNIIDFFNYWSEIQPEKDCSENLQQCTCSHFNFWIKVIVSHGLENFMPRNSDKFR